MKLTLYLVFLISVTFSCNNKHADTSTSDPKFDKIKWQTKEHDDYPYRNEMLDDLINNVTLKGLKNAELIHLLGPPDRTDNGHLFYQIAQKRIGDFPLSTKTLVIKLTKDSIVEWRKIHGG